MPPDPVPPPPAQNTRGASQKTVITSLAGRGVGGHSFLPISCGCWEQLTVAGDSCPVPACARPRTAPCRQPSRAPASAPRGTAMRCHSLLLTLCALAGKGCLLRGEAWGAPGHPLPLPLGVCHLWVCSAMHRPARVSLYWQAIVPMSCPGEVSGMSGVGDTPPPPRLHTGTLIHTGTHSCLRTPTVTRTWTSPLDAHPAHPHPCQQVLGPSVALLSPPLGAPMACVLPRRGLQEPGGEAAPGPHDQL